MSFRNAAMAALCVVAAATVQADVRPDDHAPIGVMGDHVHHKGEWMLSYRAMRMSMEGNQDGTSDISPEEIVSSNPLRVVPTEMTMDMHMFGAMVAPTDRFTLMVMTSYVEKEMDHITFAGPTGTVRRGEFTTRTRGFGDTSVSALIRLTQGHTNRWHATLGVSLPTGSVDETDRILTPMGTTPEPRLPYPMQLGSGSTDLITGLTYASDHGRWGWGGQWRSVLRLQDNDEDYRLGDEHRLQGWLSYRVQPWVSVSARLAFYDRGNIDGRDPRIAAPVQTADPDRQALERWDLQLGANVVLPGSHRLALEFGRPLRQKLDGPQMETDWTLTLGWQLSL